MPLAQLIEACDLLDRKQKDSLLASLASFDEAQMSALKELLTHDAELKAEHDVIKVEALASLKMHFAKQHKESSQKAERIIMNRLEEYSDQFEQA